MRKEPKRNREKVTYENILVAARFLYIRDGRDRFSMKNLQALTGTSIGTIYTYFEDRVAIFDAITPNRPQDYTKDLS